MHIPEGTEAADIQQWASAYQECGWSLVRIARIDGKPQKGPRDERWEKIAYTVSDFSSGDNIGLKLGAASNGLVDIDCDIPEAVALAPYFLPATGLVSGRENNRNSHYWYIVTDHPEIRVKKWQTRETGMVVELRATGGQTVVAPSEHPEGGVYQWATSGDPARIEAEALRRAVAKTATGAVLAHYWQEGGTRHDMGLPIAGLLLSTGWSEDDARSFVGYVAQVAGHANPRDRVAAVRDTYRKAANKQRTQGIPSLLEYLPDKIVDKLVEWCREASSATRPTTDTDIDWTEVEQARPLRVVPRTQEQQPPLDDEEENARLILEERELDDPPPTPQPEIYTCPDILWQGMFADIADRLQKRSFEVWMGILCAMGAIAHKNLHWHYHRPLYGMVYGLLISPTGQGKGFCTDICAALLPQDYTTRDSVQSGPALAPILAKIEKDQKGKVLYTTPRPAILIIEEWTALVKMSKIEFSNLQDVLNVLFHRTRPWNISRSDTQKSGGDVVVNNPILSICATTTASLMQEYVSESMIRSGFLNRYLVLPGASHVWDFYDEEGAGIDAGQIRGSLDSFTNYAWGAGKNVWSAYTPEAKERLIQWGRQTFNPLMQIVTIEAEGLKRLHTYSHIIPLLYAWSTRSPQVLLSHVEAAIAVITISKRFVEYLLNAGNQDIPKHKQYEMNLEGRILAKIDREPGINSRKAAMDLRKSGSFQDITTTIKRLIDGGMLRQQKAGRSYVLYRTVA